jgi:N-acetylneuraminate synthase
VDFSFHQQIQIGAHTISNDHPCFIIAEAGVNHNGDMNLARSLVDIAAEAGVDAVKFQAFKTEELILSSVEKAPYQKASTKEAESQFDMLKRLEINLDQTASLKTYAESKGLVFLTTPFDFSSLQELKSLKLDGLKISSTDITNLPFLESAATLGTPIFLSTGMAYMDEVRKALHILEPLQKDVILLQCTANYPIEDSEANLNVIRTYQDAFGMLVGYSDHSVGTGAAPFSVAMGARVVEKHFTIDKEMKGPDHAASLSPTELKSLTQKIRQVEAYLGSSEKAPTQSETKTRKSLQKCIIASSIIKMGDVFTRDNITTKRTGGLGISAFQYFDLLGQKAQKSYVKDEVI